VRYERELGVAGGYQCEERNFYLSIEIRGRFMKPYNVISDYCHCGATCYLCLEVTISLASAFLKDDSNRLPHYKASWTRRSQFKLTVHPRNWQTSLVQVPPSVVSFHPIGLLPGDISSMYLHQVWIYRLTLRSIRGWNLLVYIHEVGSLSLGWSRNSPPLMEQGNIVPCSQEIVTGTYRVPNECSPHLHILFL
jgi:hypothetical protein